VQQTLAGREVVINIKKKHNLAKSLKNSSDFRVVYLKNPPIIKLIEGIIVT